MKKIYVFFLIIISAPIIAGIYGILHDEITYTISNEYYTKFKFFQFGLMDLGNEAIFPNPRLEVGLVGILATWWVGIPIGIILGLVGLLHKNGKAMFKITLKSILITLLVALLIGIFGFLYGKFYLVETGVHWWFPENLNNKENFIIVGSIHNFSYLGGLIGLIIAVIYSISKKDKYRTNALKT